MRKLQGGGARAQRPIPQIIIIIINLLALIAGDASDLA